jgi:glutamate dehydrogenase (NAD(P)+)
VFYGTREFLNDPVIMAKSGLAPGIKDKTFIIQGFGNVGYFASKFITETGGKIIGVAERDGSIYNPDGFDPENLREYILK